MSIKHDIESAVTEPPYTIFTKLQKNLIIGIVSCTAAISAFASNIYFPAIPTIAHDLSTTTELVNLTVTGYMIFQGLAPPFWGALSDAKGRRITFMCTLAVFLAACIPLGLTRSYAELLVLRCLKSAGSASTIAVGSGVIGDITRKEDRGGYMGIFQAMIVIPLAVGPILGGFLAENLGWRSVFWFLTIYGGICLLVIALFLPETLRSLVGNGSIPAKGVAKCPLAEWQRKRASLRVPSEDICDTKPAHIDLVGWIRILRARKAVLAILFSSMHYATWQAVLTALASIFQETYGLSLGKVGLVYTSNGAGAIIGTFLTGKLLDYDYAKLKRAGNGFVKEEARLRTVWVWSLIQASALLVFGWTSTKHVHISVPIISLFFLGWTPVAIQGTVATYLVDVYPKQSASATASMNFCRCLIGAGMSALVGPLISGITLGWALTLMAGVVFLTFAVGVWAYLWEARHPQREAMK